MASLNLAFFVKKKECKRIVFKEGKIPFIAKRKTAKSSKPAVFNLADVTLFRIAKKVHFILQY